VLQYQHMYPLTPDVERLAIELRDRFMPRIAECGVTRLAGHRIQDTGQVTTAFQNSRRRSR